MQPRSCSIVDAVTAPEKSLSFLFWGAGVFVLPIIAIYTAVVYWVFSGRSGARMALKKTTGRRLNTLVVAVGRPAPGPVP